MEKAIEIKRRAQRCILNGDLDGALSEYERLVASGDSDPYHSVLLADLLYKKGDPENAARRYFEAVDGYQKAGLLKNGIAVCKKMSRLSFAPAAVLERLAQLHALDGFATEASLYYMQHGEIMQNQNYLERAAGSFEKAFQTHPENVKALERFAEALHLQGEAGKAAAVLLDAASHYDRQGQLAESKRCQARADYLSPGATTAANEAAAENAAHAPALETLPPPLARPHEDLQTDLGAESSRDLVFPRLPDGGESAAPGFGADPGPLRIESSSLDAEQAQEAEEDEEEGVEVGEEVEEDQEVVEQIYDLDAAEIAEIPPPEGFESSATSVFAKGVDAPPFTAAAFGAIDLESRERTLAPPSAPVTAAAPEMPAEEAYSLGDGIAGAFPDFVPGARVPFGDLSAAAAPAGPAAEPPAFESAADSGADHGANPDAVVLEAGAAAEFDFTSLNGSTSPSAPGLAFDAPAAGPRSDADADAAPVSEEAGLAEVSAMLAAAQEMFKTGDRDAAGSALANAAQAYDRIGRYDSAASIYRSLSQTTTGSPQVMMLWLKNCQRRADHREAAHVACELGERALNVGDLPGAQEWFERAQAFDDGNEIAQRRLQRLTQPDPAGAGTATAVAAPAPESQQAPRPAAPASALAPVGVQMDQSIPENVDLGVLISEFQRSVSVELAGDAQSHYDLGMSYREMGLIDESLESFGIAARDSAFRLRASEMIGRCLLDLGRFDEASQAIRLALAEPGLAADSRLNLRYQLALALEAAGDIAGALGEFEGVYSAAASYADVAVRIRALRKSMGMA